MSVQHNIDQVTRRFNEIADNLDKDLDKAMRLTTQHIQDETEKGIEPHTDTGALINAVKSGTVADGYWTGVDTQAAPHAIFVHFPTRPHLIKPKKKKALRWPSGGGFSFAKEVSHPGYKGDPFFYDAVDKGMRFLDRQAHQLKLRG